MTAFPPGTFALRFLWAARGALLAVLVVAFWGAVAQPAHAAPVVALTFDDGTPSEAMNAGILKALADAQVRSILFVAGKNVDSPDGLAQVRAWGAAGHLIANHTYLHRSLGRPDVTATEFQADVLRNHALLQALPGFTRLFRFPFLKEGDTAEERDEIRKFLRRNRYRSGRVTIDASDWYYDIRLRKHLDAHPGPIPEAFGRAYLEHLWDRTLYYDGLSRKVVGRSVKHTLLLHVNALNAALLPDVIRMYRDRGWEIVDPDAAFADPVYKRDPKTVPAGESLVWSLAKEKGVSDLRYPAENDTYERPILEAAGF